MLTKSLNTGICVVGRLNQLFIRFYVNQLFEKNIVVSGKTPFFVIG